MSETDMRGWPAPETEGAAEEPEAPFTGVDMADDGLPTEEAIRTALKAVLDPEIGINIVDLGLVYDVTKDEGGKVVVDMTLTSMGCPLTELLHQQCTLVLTRLPGVEEVEVNFVFTPPWTTDMISDEAKEELRAMGFQV